MPENDGRVALSVEYPNVHWGHFGGNDRATDEFIGCDAMVIVGLFCHNIGALERRVQALRFAKKPPKSDPAEARGLYEGYVDAEGAGRDYPIKIHEDADVQNAIEHSMASTIVQAAGRLRAACRTREDGRPFPVVIFSAQPFRGLHVNGLHTLDDLLARDKGRFSQVRDTLNAQRRAEAEAKLEAAMRQGVTGTRALIDATGLSSHTVIKYLQRSTQPAGREQSVDDMQGALYFKALHTGTTNIYRQQCATPNSQLTVDIMQPLKSS